MRKIVRRGAIVLAFSVTVPAPVLAADLPTLKEAPAPAPAPIPSGWRFEATINGWAPSSIANAGVGHLPTVSSNLGFFTLLRHLNGVVPLAFTAKNENFILGLDLYWSAVSAGAHVRASNTALGPYGGLNGSLRLSETFLMGYAGVRLPIQIANLAAYGIAGARFSNVNTTIDLNTFIPGIGLSGAQSENWTDPIIGFTANYAFNDKWFLTTEADIGGTGNSATWQAFGALGYNWTPRISSTVGFRALYVDYRKWNGDGGSFRFQQTLLGPQATISYAF
ncbi:hypothetical protein K9U39_05190 [Rhodoblastus acidophilus]|uniref:Outer membrane protein beta-barrel domain-containing protein n=1 Tax=Candidatus Rhodoblastus alkanivorans TaxID=2954117 RepID=A0ABS9Z615_9HYPH|nr:hypothetical protein [Candidatus Rhodoblastus alkanivorans]MCI4678627.1 hypothetical protein [Candidatus Rhodoblastus alkanivorans]MCI4683037.1 hypothetical protein [Candidatus Rhodoblastus alkanivorans]MDI4640347.1 hypothetical protein [Rhodoblastus acidophilus]